MNMAKQQYRWNFRLKKSNVYLGTIYLAEPLPLKDDVVMMGEKKYLILEIIPGSSPDSSEVFVEEEKKK
jgi:hypothetical protein